MNRKQILMHLLFTIITLGAGLFAIPQQAEASGASLKIQPGSLQIQAVAPSGIQAPFTIENPGDTSITLKIVLKRFRDAGEESGKVVYSTLNLTDSTKNDAFLDKVEVLDDNIAIDSLTLGPKQKKKLLFTLSLETTDRLQDHYFSLLFLTQPDGSNRTEPEDEEENTVTTIQTGIALPILLSVGASSTRDGLVEAYTAPFFIQTGPVPFTIKIKNTGEHFLTAHGVIFIKNMFGQTIGKVDVPKTTILAGTTRSLTADGQKQIFWTESFLLGFYTADLHIAITPDQILYTRSTYFISFPWSFVIGFFVVVLLLFFFLRRIKKKVSEQ